MTEVTCRGRRSTIGARNREVVSHGTEHHWDYGWVSRVFGVLDVAVPLGFACEGVAREVAFRGRCRTLRAFDVWMGKDSCQAQGIARV